MSRSSARPLRNVLFVMCDQLRADYLSCYGHPRLHTPHIDALAARGLRFDRAFVQGAVCGASRMSTYTGRYVSSHGAMWNFVPLSVGQKTLGDHLRAHGVRCALVGKTHVEPDTEGAARLGLDVSQGAGLLAMHGGFEPYARDDGIWPPGFKVSGNAYCDWLRERGYASDNPWHDFANSGRGPGGEIRSGWEMRWAGLPAAVAEPHSETPYTTDRAIDFMREAGDRPWVLHLSYIKPHWPYVAPAPYHAMYGPRDVLPAVRGEAERRDAHPVLAGFRDDTASRSFSRDEVRETVIPTYMGLVKQLDDQLGRLFGFMAAQGLDRDTLVVFTSDHGDYLGDHWLGEKELFHEPIVRVPLIVVDPRERADATRGGASAALVECIDIVPTVLDALGLPQPAQWLEGRSLLPLVRADPRAAGKDFVVCENSYAFRDSVRLPLGQPVERCHMTMLRDARWKFVHVEDLPPMLFDLEADPGELVDLGRDPAFAWVRERMLARMFDWLRERRRFPTIAPAAVEAWNRREREAGILIGAW
ncbi:phosphonate monoester hydrolase [Variovorax paradoxus]|jgi:arylsulfatase A-like enzyme|uniref:sulfatase-like hydrolase/transferase n=1 Tax=Variovorax TaxID=34072 RepID=UPI0006E6E64E|nr:sulfatase-like hydrolase/transferase [Variovorax sp. CY25R-8]KPU88173.1 phosphonate monoester hydrolase [Variovorax paradoxus]KPU90426.1 phosphonate monoester hydrolase [Variovorax paradoxus]KPV01048.1 phosphonate monoester hydrolase [Variovorax paradoxus]KPV11319.1 phosphonate monoester hydrolase [Variovorax paradoxus]KPV18702.1 phosphonate monoester hydrolase [Variovorax paradoxus]